MKKLTPADLVDPKMQSGYRHVQHVIGGHGTGRPFRARIMRGKFWNGPRRSTALQAAWDYCNRVNTGQSPVSLRLPTITHKRPKRRPRPAQPDHIAEKRAEVREYDRSVAATLPTQNHIYLIAIQGCREAVKVGESWDPNYRAADGQTWHWREVVVLGSIPTDIPKGADKVLHQKLAQHHIANEFFRPAREVLSHFGVSFETFMRKTAVPRRAAA